MNNVKLLHIKCCFFQFFNSPVALKNNKKFAPKKELKWRPCKTSFQACLQIYGASGLDWGLEFFQDICLVPFWS